MVKVDAGAFHGLDDAARRAVDAEREGYAGLWSAEANHDPFYPLVAAAGVTSTLTLGTAIAVAFSRNPMSMAVSANDIHTATGGRFILGLGSQIRAHIERRYSMPWSRPAARMREYVHALRAIWTAWELGGPLDFRGDFYTHTLMTPMFSPGPNPYGTPPVFVAALGGEMTRVAGEVADGFIGHPFTTERYLREVTLPALAEGRSLAGSSMAGFEILGQRMITTGATEEELNQAVAWTRERIAFYASTPAYRRVLAVHGWDDVHPELNRLSRQGRWSDMSALVSDEMLHTISVVGTPREVGVELARRYGATLTRISFSPAIKSAQVWQGVRAGLVADGSG